MQLLAPFVGVPRNRILCGSAENLFRFLPDNSIDMGITSPPYDNLRTYNGFSWDFPTIAREYYRVLKPGGVLVWVVGDATVNGSETLTSMRQALHFVDVCGFRMHDTMIWSKGATAFPDVNRYYQSWEFMFVVSKGQPATVNLQTQPNKYAGSNANHRKRLNGNDLVFNPHAKGRTVKAEGVMPNVWNVSPGYGKTTADKIAYEHPAIFPEEIVDLHVKTWTNPGNIVLDCFMGSGTTAKMARNNSRDYIGFEASSDYCEIARVRLLTEFGNRYRKESEPLSDLPMFAASA